MDQEAFDFKKFMPLAKFEFSLFKALLQLEQNFGLKNAKILLNLQVSGGKDSMCLLNAFAAVLSSRVCKLKNEYVLIVQHFNHKKRGKESDEDSFFVAQESLQRGIPAYLYSLLQEKVNGNFQDYARNWRKQNAKLLSSRLSHELNCEKYFIVTAHHARDHVETVLMHLLRGSGIEGLKGISLFDEENICFRPFSALPYAEITNYLQNFNISFREDSSNLTDKYKRNYIRQHILPHFEYLQKDYENSFIKLSQHILESTHLYTNEETYTAIIITKKTTPSNLFHALKLQNKTTSMSENCIKNILYEAQLLLQKKENNIVKEVALKEGNKIRLEKNGEKVLVNFKSKP